MKTFQCGGHHVKEPIGNQKARDKDRIQHYKIKQPSLGYKVPKALVEISGISSVSPNLLYCLEDQHGIIYTFDLVKNQVVSKTRVLPDGDYEEICSNGKAIFILESNGNLNMINMPLEAPTINKWDIPLETQTECEAMAYDSKSNSILILPKFDKNTILQKVDQFTIIKFNLKTLTFAKFPLFNIKRNQLEQYRSQNGLPLDFLNFSPSGMAIHPFSNHIYCLSAKSSMIYVFDLNGNIIDNYVLPQAILPQAEGICFDHTGDMYLSSESPKKKGKAALYKYKYFKLAN